MKSLLRLAYCQDRVGAAQPPLDSASTQPGPEPDFSGPTREVQDPEDRPNRVPLRIWSVETAEGTDRCSEAAIRTEAAVWVDRPNRTFALCYANTRVGPHMLSDLQSTPDSHPNPPQSRSPAARRMARHRRRRRDGMRCVTVELRETEIDQLIGCRLLAPSSRADPLALRKAVHGLFDQLFP